MTRLILAAAMVVGLMVAFVVIARRVDRRNSLESQIQASMARRYKLSRDVWFGRAPVYVRPEGTEWAQWTPPPAPAIEAAPVAEPVEGAA